jgi:hypothetical protein
MCTTLNKLVLLIVTLRYKFKKKMFSVTEFCQNSVADHLQDSISSEIRKERGGPVTVACVPWSGAKHNIILSNSKAAYLGKNY